MSGLSCLWLASALLSSTLCNGDARDLASRASLGPAHPSPGLRGASVENAGAAATDMVVSQRAVGHCHCDGGASSCTCDLALADLDVFLVPLGYDQCTEDGACELCHSEELTAPYCLRTRHRQRVACAQCALPGSPPAFCGPDVQPFWVANASHVREAEMQLQHVDAGEARMAHGAGIFFRSCGDALVVTASRGPRANTVEDEAARNSSFGSRGGVDNIVMPGSQHQDESIALLNFLAFNFCVLTFAGRSLRRQQLRLQERLMQNLDISASTDVTRVSERGTARRAAEFLGAGRTSAAAAEVAAAVSREAGAIPENIGRSIETLASAVARKSSALEIKVREISEEGRAEKMK